MPLLIFFDATCSRRGVLVKLIVFLSRKTVVVYPSIRPIEPPNGRITEMSTPADNALIEKAVAGDLASSKLLLYSNHKRLLTYINKHFPQELKGVFEANDILQEVWLRALAGIRQFKGRTAAQLYQWLKTIAKNLISDQVRHVRLVNRKGSRIVTDENLDDSTIVNLLEEIAVSERTPSKSAVSNELLLNLSFAIKQLPEDQREVIRLRYIGGLELGAVAEQMKRSNGAVATLCFRAIKSLRDEMLSGSSVI
jgi:RNA polymerase sigma-70 factor, ECF subfamily